MEAGAGLPVRRQCQITLRSLAENFGILSMEVKGYLDLETGEVLIIVEDTWSDLETVWEGVPEELADSEGEERQAALIAAIAAQGPLNSEEEMILEADAVEQGLGARYRRLPEAESRVGYQDMELFIDSHSDARLRDRLERAIRGRGAFRRFRDVLNDTENETERWYAFKQQRQEARARDWLADENIELLEDAD